MAEPSQFDAIVTRILAGEAAPNIRAAAARGALPLPRSTLVRLQIHLLQDAEDAIQAAAGASLNALDVPAIREVLEDPHCPIEVLAHFAPRAARDEGLAEALAFNPTVPVSALALLAGGGSAPVIELVLTNQERLLAHPQLLERLMDNPALRVDQRGRLLELLERSSRSPRRVAVCEEDDDAEFGADDEIDAETAARLLNVDVGELLSASEIMGADEIEQSEDLGLISAYKKILMLGTAQKAILAMKGGREERMILIRDTNKTVSLGVLRNGRLTETEVETISRMRNVHIEVLRLVGSNREWIRNYAVVTSLVNNPRTPQGISTNFVPRLTNRDLKQLAANRDIPELVRRMAKRTYDTRTQPQRKTYKKK